MDNFRYIKNVATLSLDAEHCIGCGRCVEVCPHAVLVLESGRARIVDLDACMECGACARNCPVAVLSVDSGVGCASGLLSEWLEEKFSLRIKGGC